MSGTYNNQYMIVDLKKVTLGHELTNGTLWVIEQIPGLVVGADQTTVLRAGLFSMHYLELIQLVWLVKTYFDCCQVS